MRTPLLPVRDISWDRPSVARRQRDELRSRLHVAPESRDADEETELAFHKVWLANELSKMPEPAEREPVELPEVDAGDVVRSIDGLRSACGLNPLPRRKPVLRRLAS